MKLVSPETIRRSILTGVAILSACAPAMAGSISYSSPSSGSTVSSPIHVKASASSSYSIRYMNIYLDGNKVASGTSSSIDKYVSSGAGSHRITVQAEDSSGSIFKKSIYVTVGSSSSSTSTKTFSNIDQMSKWSSCSACAGANGDGPVTTYSQTLGLSSPSMDGNSTKFHIGGSTAYANALWWKQLGANSSARHFTYDLYFYLKNPSLAQALEFDVNQSLNGKKYIFGTECVKSTKTWKVYSASLKWVNTGISCAGITAYKWNHLVWEFQRTTDGKVSFVSVSLNGVKHYVNRSYAPKSGTANEINVAFQMDGDKYMTDYDTWLEKVKLTYW
jgi:hypothetical protein